MKRFLPLFAILVVFSSCEEDVRFNNPGFQGLKDDVLWQANDVRAYVSSSGRLTVEGYSQFEKVVIGANSVNTGKYVLGTTNLNNFASYSSTLNGTTYEYATTSIPGPVFGTALVSGGTGYSTSGTVETIGGSGGGLTVAITANASGVVTKIIVVSPGNNYIAGDVITVAGGGLNCKFRVLNVRDSNGEVQITEYDAAKMTVSGKFKFNAVNVSPFGNQVVNFQYGEFYRIPIYPEQ